MRLYLSGYFTFYITSRQAKWIDVDLKRPTRLSDVLTELGIPPAEVYLAVVNGQIVSPQETEVMEQDEVRLYPAISGG